LGMCGERFFTIQQGSYPYLSKIRRTGKLIEFKGEKVMMVWWGENVVFLVLWIQVGILYPLRV